MDIEFRGELTKDIYFKAIRWIYKPSKKTMLIRAAVFVVFSLLYLVLIVAAIQKEGNSAYETSRLLRHLFTFLLLAYILLQPTISAYRKANTLWNDPGVPHTRAGKVSSLGILQAPQTEWMNWDTFTRVHQTPEFIILLTPAGKFFLLQRSFFRDEQEWKLVQSIVESKTRPVTD